MTIWRYVVIISTLCGISAATAQDTLVLSRSESEALFLKNNLQLIANRLDIEQAQAQVLQARLWPNPTLEIEEVNLWATQRQIDIGGEELPTWGKGDLGKYQQFAASLEQLIITAGKRKKLIAIEEVGVEKAEQYFEDLLRNLKLEFRNLLTELQYLQLKYDVYARQLGDLRKLSRSYKNQLERGHISRAEYVRLKAIELEILDEIKTLKKDINSIQKELKTLLHLPSSSYLVLEEEGFKREIPSQLLAIDDLLAQAKINNPEFKLAVLEEKSAEKSYAYERAQRIPDVSLKVAYDRGGNILYNFVGFGLEFDLPLLDRNQGNIKAAEIGIDQTAYQRQEKENELENALVEAFLNLQEALAMAEEIEPDYESSLDLILERYVENFGRRNISLLEFSDFFETYLQNKSILLETEKEINGRIETLNYIIGTDILK